MTEFFDRNGKRMSLMQWARAFDDSAYRVLGSHTVGNLWVSTVWLGINHGMPFDQGPPYIFESMIFAVPEGDDQWRSLEMRRYRTEREAMVGHAELVHIANVMNDVDHLVHEGGDDDEREANADLHAEGDDR